MILITSHTTSPWFNLAAEEYLLRNFSDDVFMLYINEPSVIVGKHQNVFAELNYWFINDNNLKVVRRLSGGGTVFHDLGNLNFCFIQNGKEGNLINFRRYTQPIIDVLLSMGVPAMHSGRNDILVNDLKVSGNAEHVFRNRTLHHGTLLFNAQLNNLSEALHVDQTKFQDKGVRSVRSQVTNICNYLPESMDIARFQNSILAHIKSAFDAVDYTFTENDLLEIEKLVTEKYSLWDWNWGYSPKFTVEKNGTIEGDFWEVQLTIDKGILLLSEIKINGVYAQELSDILKNIPYSHTQILRILKPHGQADQIVRLLF